MHRPRLLAAAATATAVAGLLAGCAAPGAGARSHVVVRIAAAEHPAAYQVRLAQARGAYRAVHTMHSGETRTFAVPVGWLTVRIPGLCVVPTPNSGTTTVHVARNACTIA